MKKLITKIKGNNQVQFTIRREIFASGKERLTPMIKIPGFMQSWTGITKDHGKYFPVVINEQYSFTRDECHEYILGYKIQIELENAKKIVNVIFEGVI